MNAYQPIRDHYVFDSTTIKAWMHC